MAKAPLVRDGGFTLIELQIVIAIMAIIAAVTVPSVQSERQNQNEIAAVASLNDIVAGQAQFAALDPDVDAKADVAASLHELGGVRYIDDDLGNGQKSGYVFTMGSTPTPGASSWHAGAKPITKKTNGRRSFFVDQSGVIRESYRPVANQRDPVVDTIPTPTPNPAPDALQKLALAAIKKLDKQSGGQALPAAKAFVLPPFNVNTMLAKLDRDSDSSIRFAETLGPDVLAQARQVKQQLGIVDPGPPLGADGVVDMITRTYLATIAKKLRFAGCESSPNVPFAALSGDAKGFLDQVR